MCNLGECSSLKGSYLPRATLRSDVCIHDHAASSQLQHLAPRHTHTSNRFLNLKRSPGVLSNCLREYCLKYYIGVESLILLTFARRWSVSQCRSPQALQLSASRLRGSTTISRGDVTMGSTAGASGRPRCRRRCIDV